MKRIISAPDAAPSVFPPLDFSALLNYVRIVWDELRRRNLPWWNADKETTIVSGFYMTLNSDEMVTQYGIGFGHFATESQEIDIDPRTNLPRQVGRTDITFAHASWMGPVLTMEFKRLNNGAALRRKYCTEGILRFVDGRYSDKHDTAVMVGLVQGSAIAEKAALLTYLSRPQTIALLQAQAMNHPAYGDPSIDAPAVDFDTQHNRPAHCAAQTIRLGHILLER